VLTLCVCVCARARAHTHIHTQYIKVSSIIRDLRFMALKILIAFFWVVTPCSLVGGYQCFYLEDGGDTFLPKIGNHLQHYALSQPRRPWLINSMIIKSHIWFLINIIKAVDLKLQRFYVTSKYFSCVCVCVWIVWKCVIVTYRPNFWGLELRILYKHIC
jgi:hypothetical protein